jgi:hypothetical protein
VPYTKNAWGGWLTSRRLATLVPMMHRVPRFAGLRWMTRLLAVLLGLGCAETQPLAGEEAQSGAGGSSGAGSRSDAGGGRDAGDTDPADGGDAMVAVPDSTTCYAELDCDRQRCDDYEPVETGCSNDSAMQGIYEGDCGDYRYRSDGTWFSGTVHYWVRSTGKLVAIVWYTDHNPSSSCLRRVRGDRSVYEQCEVASRFEACADADAGASVDADGGS